MRYSAKHQAQVDAFVRTLVDALTQRFPDAIDFAILFGSAARGEFIPGISDIDLIIQAKQDADVPHIEREATRIFWKLNSSMGMGFEKSCAQIHRGTLHERIFSRLEAGANLYTPLFIFGPSDLDWERGVVKKSSLVLVANAVVSQATVFYKLKTEGKIYYGRDIRRVIRPRMSWWERFKGLIIPGYLVLFALLIAPAFPYRAVKYCIKAILYSIDSAIIYLQNFQKLTRSQKIATLKDATDMAPELRRVLRVIKWGEMHRLSGIAQKDFGIVEESLLYKMNGFSGSIPHAWEFVLRAGKYPFLRTHC